MAVHTGNNEQVETGANDKAKIELEINSQLGGAMPKSETVVDNTPVLTFGGKKFSTMASGLGSEYLNKLSDELKAIYASEAGNGYQAKVTVLDREVKSNLAYSAVIVSIAKSNKVAYFIMQLEGTGRKPLDAATVMQEYNNLARSYNPNKINDIYVASDAIDVVLFNEIKDTLKKTYGEHYNFYSVDGVVIPYYNNDLSPAALRPIASIAYNACLVEIGKINKEFRDLNISEAIKEAPGAYLKIDSNLLPTTIMDAAGKPIRADWQIELNSIDNRNVAQSLNLQNNRTRVCKTTGFVDAMQEEFTVQALPGAASTSMIRLRPHVILTSMDTDMPTTGYALLAIISSVVMVRPNMWLAAVAPKPNDQLHDIGKLNISTNLENNSSGFGEPLDLRDSKLNSQELFSLIKQMYSLDAMFSIDIDAYGTYSNFASIFGVAAAPANSDVGDKKYAAAQEILSTAVWLTNGAFPHNFPANEIFLNDGVNIPTGTWTDKDGATRDIRDLDLSAIATLSAPNQVSENINKWTLSNVPQSVSGIDPFITKVDIISKLIPNAEISGKATRVTFSSKFIQTLSSACASAGFETRYDPEVQFTEQSSIAAIGNYLSGAGIGQQSADFARSFAGGNSYQTPYATAGFNRFQ